MKVESDVKNITSKVFGKVVKIILGDKHNEIVINKGERDGISIDDRFLIYEAGEELFDPDTQESLGKLETVKGIAQPKSELDIQEKMTILIPAKQIIYRKLTDGVSFLLTLQKFEVIKTPIPISFQDANFRDINVGDFVKPMKNKI